MTAEPLYLDGGVFALLHPARGRVPVVLCGPPGWDDVASYRPRRDWAERLAAAGHRVVRFDPPGSGDSAGGPDDPALVDAWVAAVGSAARLVGGGAPVAAIGIGVAGLVVLRAAAAGAPIGEAVLWGTPARGRAAVRELKAFARLETAAIVAAGAPEPPPGPLAPGGFRFSDETVAALAGLEAGDGAVPPRVLLLERDGLAVDAELRALLEQGGADVTVAPGPGYGAMTGTPGLSRAPEETIAAVERWLGPGAAPTAVPHAETVLDLGAVRERPFRVGGMLGVLAEPTHAPQADTTLVLLNAGGVRRIGPNRMWVDIARRWAARGLPVLRVDLAGLGDADGDSGFTGDADFYAAESAAQVRAVLDALEADGLPPQFVLGGLCSGAYWSFRVALEDDRVAAALLLNSRVLVWDDALEGARGLRWLRRNFHRPGAWRRVLRGEIRVDPRRLAASAARALVRRGRGDEVAAALDRLRDRGVGVDLVFCDGEPLHAELPPLDPWPNATLRLVPGRDHLFRPVWMHEHVHAAVDAALRSHGAPADRAAVPAPVGDGHPQRDA